MHAGLTSIFDRNHTQQVFYMTSQQGSNEVHYVSTLLCIMIDACCLHSVQRQLLQAVSWYGRQRIKESRTVECILRTEGVS
jgi:hypothetical protein